jgi:hypothetical protein
MEVGSLTSTRQAVGAVKKRRRLYPAGQRMLWPRHRRDRPAGYNPVELRLAAARWAVDVSSGGRALDDPERIGAAHREELQRSSRPVASPAQQKVHRLLASQPLPPLNEVYQTVFEEILGQRVSPPDTERVQAERAFAAARRAKLPVLLILHKSRDNQTVLDEWNRMVASPRTVVPDQAEEEGEDEVGLVGRGGRETLGPAAGRVRRPGLSALPLFPGIRHRVRSHRRPSVPAVASSGDLATTKEVSCSNPLTALARSYVVVALRLEELPALSHQLGIPPEPGAILPEELKQAPAGRETPAIVPSFFDQPFVILPGPLFRP